jgi:hypothetical protein
MRRKSQTSSHKTGSGTALLFRITNNRANEYVGVDRNLHKRPDQPADAASLIS